MLLDHPLLSQRYFFPSPGRPSRGAFEVMTRTGERLVCLREEREGARFTVVYFHGNGETAADHVPDPADAWLDLGVNFVVVTYRGYGESTGVPQLAAMLSDGEDVLEALGVPDEEVIAVGRSLGSLYACELVHRRPRIAGLILESGIADVLERVLIRVDPLEIGASKAELRAEVDAALNQQKKLAGYGGKVLILHAEHDTLVTPWHAERTAEWSRGRLVMFAKGDHNSILYANRDQYFAEIRSFLAGL